jgi:hypothetical protein
MVIPTTQFLQFDVTVNPSGNRNLLGSAVKELSTSLNSFLDFSNLNISISGIVSPTKLVVFRASDMGTASGIYNIRFYLKSASAFGPGTYRFLHRISTHYLGSNFILNTADNDLPSIQPATQNLFSTQQVNAISGITDADVSQYIYLAVFVDTDVPFGTYRGQNGAGATMRCVYDFS